VARAFDRIVDGTFIPTDYSAADIALVSSIAPTDFLRPAGSNPHGANYHFLYGSADGDVSGDVFDDVTQAFHIFERATGFRQSTYVHGADHNDFNCCGFDDFTGPPGTAIGRARPSRSPRPCIWPWSSTLRRREHPQQGYLWRQYERLPIGVAASTTVVTEYKEGPSSGKFVIDDYQSAPSPLLSSAGGLVRSQLDVLREGRLDDANFDFTWVAADPFNGMARGSAADSTAGAVLSTSPGSTLDYLLWIVPPASRDLSPFGYLSFRACQGTRHPLTIARLGDESWGVMLLDTSGGSSLIDFSVYGGGVEEPYQRTGSGSGAGWQNEFGRSASASRITTGRQARRPSISPGSTASRSCSPIRRDCRGRDSAWTISS
jgi:hypothetical protein